MIEAGVPDYQATSWYGLYVPAGTPTAVIASLNAVTTKVAQAEAFKSRVASEGLVISTGTPQQLDEFMRGEQTRWALENLNITDARLKTLGATDLLPEIKTSCDNHEGSGKVRIQQWDGAKWVPVSDWIEGNKNLIHPLFKATAAQYAKEKGFTPACMKS